MNVRVVLFAVCLLMFGCTPTLTPPTVAVIPTLKPTPYGTRMNLATNSPKQTIKSTPISRVPDYTSDYVKNISTKLQYIVEGSISDYRLKGSFEAAQFLINPDALTLYIIFESVPQNMCVSATFDIRIHQLICGLASAGYKGYIEIHMRANSQNGNFCQGTYYCLTPDVFNNLICDANERWFSGVSATNACFCSFNPSEAVCK